MSSSTVLTEKANGAPVEFAVPEKPFGARRTPRALVVPAPQRRAGPGRLPGDPYEGQTAISHDFIACLPDIEDAGLGTDLQAQDVPLGDAASVSNSGPGLPGRVEQAFLG